MPVNKEAYKQLNEELAAKKVTLVAVSKTKPVEDILELYALGHRDFGENYVQELVDKANKLPKDIRWHFIGHLQRNKVKYISPFIHLIHGVDSVKLFTAINSDGFKNNRIINCLLQVHIAQEETKFGFEKHQLKKTLVDLSVTFSNINIIGLMGMASFTEDMNKVRSEFKALKSIFDKYSEIQNPKFKILSMGMSSDYKVAIEEGSNMVRIGSLIFGERK
jgi:PLP dependent protein